MHKLRYDKNIELGLAMQESKKYFIFWPFDLALGPNSIHDFKPNILLYY